MEKCLFYKEYCKVDSNPINLSLSHIVKQSIFVMQLIVKWTSIVNDVHLTIGLEARVGVT